jgi:hypothetical protein
MYLPPVQEQPAAEAGRMHEDETIDEEEEEEGAVEQQQEQQHLDDDEAEADAIASDLAAGRLSDATLSKMNVRTLRYARACTFV